MTEPEPPTVTYNKPGVGILLGNKFERITDLVEVTGGKFINKAYRYQTESGKTFWTNHKIKGVKDTREYDERHPYLSAFEALCKHAESPAATITLGAAGIQKLRGKKLF